MSNEIVTTYFSKKTKQEARERKMFNVEAFSGFSRSGLAYSKTERRILLHALDSGEKVFIQFPGKESMRPDDKARPWDFRPKVEMADGRLCRDVSFKDIWNDIIDISKMDCDVLPVLAMLLFRMANMMDHELVDEEYDAGDFDIENSKMCNLCKIPLNYYKYSPNPELISELQSRIGNIRGMSIKAYLLMNDYLAQNEDCKYYYRDTIVKGEKWNDKVGRFNNIMTHITIIGFLRGNIKFTDVTDSFQRMRGVAPIPEKLLSDVTDGLVRNENSRYEEMKISDY